MDITTAIKVFGVTMLVAIIGSVVGVNMFCAMSSLQIEKCKRRVLFVIERLTYSIFNTLVAGLGLLGYLFYIEEDFKMGSVYFVVFLIIVLITSAMSFDVSKLIVNASRKRLENEADRFSDGE